MSITSSDRFKKSCPCPICSGYVGMPHGQGKRCFGFRSSDGEWAHCTREEYAAGLPIETGGTYAHRLTGPCKCGTVHGESFRPVLIKRPGGNGVQAHHKRPAKALGEFVCYYTYYDIMGRPLHRTLRYKNPRSFPQEHFDGSEWRSGLPSSHPHVIYNLPAVAAHPVDDPIFLVEGEKDVETALKLGVCATTSPMGAKGWNAEWGAKYAEMLRGKWIATIADNDPDGRDYIGKVSASLWRVASKNSRVDLGLAARGADLTDWVESGGDVHALRRLAVNAPLWSPDMPKGIDAVDLLGKSFPPRKWAVPGLVGDGITLLVSAPKIGKSYMILNVAVAIVCGGRALGSLEVEQGDVLYIDLEGGEQLIQERLRQMGLNPDSLPRGLDIQTEWTRLDQGGLEALDNYMHVHPNLRMIAIDTVKQALPPSPAGNAYSADLESLRPLQKLSVQRMPILGAWHTNKRIAVEDRNESVSGSNAVAGTVNNILLLQRIRGEADAKLSVSGRGIKEQNLACRFDPSLGLWTVEGSAEEVERSSARSEIVDFLRANGAPAGPKLIADAIGKSQGAIRFLLYKMSRSGEIKALGNGQYSLQAKQTFSELDK